MCEFKIKINYNILCSIPGGMFIRSYVGVYGNTWRKQKIRRLKSKWEDNIKLDVQDIGLKGVAWIDVTQNIDNFLAFVSAVLKFCVP
jgi:hypothetical protein